jgi:hypothetical protein
MKVMGTSNCKTHVRAESELLGQSKDCGRWHSSVYKVDPTEQYKDEAARSIWLKYVWCEAGQDKGASELE